MGQPWIWSASMSLRRCLSLGIIEGSTSWGNFVHGHSGRDFVLWRCGRQQIRICGTLPLPASNIWTPCRRLYGLIVAVLCFVGGDGGQKVLSCRPKWSRPQVVDGDFCCKCLSMFSADWQRVKGNGTSCSWECVVSPLAARVFPFGCLCEGALSLLAMSLRELLRVLVSRAGRVHTYSNACFFGTVIT